jgi:hypothetical protein
MKTWWLRKIIFGIVIFAAITTLLGFIVMNLWNALIPDLFKGPYITFWQSFGLLLLSHILFRGWGGPWRHSHGWRHQLFQKKFEERLAAMSPEEREKFEEKLRGRCGHFAGTSENINR